MLINFRNEDLPDLLEITKYMAAKASGNFSLSEAASLIAQAKREKQQILKANTAQEQSQQALSQAREDISTLNDREYETIQREWMDQGKQQAESYSNSKSKKLAGAKDEFRQAPLSWIRRKQHLWELANQARAKVSGE